MRIPKWFEKWFKLYGVGDERIDAMPRLPVRRIAWRAYRKGLRDGRKLSNEQLETAEHKGNMKGFKRGRGYGMDK